MTLEILIGGRGRQSERTLVVTPTYADELQRFLRAEGVEIGDVVELWSTEGWVEILAISLPAALGAGGALSVAITKFFERHKDKKIVFGPINLGGGIQSIEGYSVKDVDRLLAQVANQQRILEQALAAKDGESTDSNPNSDDNPSHTPDHRGLTLPGALGIPVDPTVDGIKWSELPEPEV